MSTNLTPPTDPANSAVPSALHAPGATTTPAPGEAGPRAGTVIWGLLFVTIGIVSIVKVTGGQVEVELLAIGGLAVAGLALLLTAVIGSRRSRRHP